MSLQSAVNTTLQSAVAIKSYKDDIKEKEQKKLSVSKDVKKKARTIDKLPADKEVQKIAMERIRLLRESAKNPTMNVRKKMIWDEGSKQWRT